jgi:membrane fusion protein
VGWVVPAAGLSQVYVTKPAMVERVLVNVGDEVRADQPLAVLSADIANRQGGLTPQQRASTLQRVSELDVQIKASEVKRDQDVARLKAHASALSDEAAHLDEERALLERQLSLAQHQLAEVQSLSARGFMSNVEKERREQAVLSAEQSLADLVRQIEAKRAEAKDAREQAAAIPTATAMDLSQLRAQRASLNEALAELATQDSLVLRAPVSGKVAAVNIRAGDTALGGAPAVSIAPAASRLIGELFVPTKAAGFIAKGQEVRLKVDAFPSERFGQVSAVVDSVSHAPLSPSQIGAPLDVKGPVYRVDVRLAADHISAYGRNQPLVPGMTVKASVVTAKRTFLESLLDPIVAAGRNAG